MNPPKSIHLTQNNKSFFPNPCYWLSQYCCVGCICFNLCASQQKFTMKLYKAKFIWSHEVYEAITLRDWHLFDCLVSRKIYISTFFKFQIFIQRFGFECLWVYLYCELTENASCKLFDEVRHHEELTQYWAKKSSHRLLRFWISAQVLITKSLCADLQITPRFYPRLTRSF